MQLSSSFTRTALVALCGFFAIAANGCSVSASNQSEEFASIREPLTASTGASNADLLCDETTTVTVEIEAGNLTSTTPVDIMLVLDDSGSIGMSAFNQMRAALMAMVNNLDDVFVHGGSIGIVQYAGAGPTWPGSPGMYRGTSRVVLPPTGEPSVVLGALSSMTHQGGYTCTSCGIDSAMEQLEEHRPAENKRIVIVLTDGQSNAVATQPPAPVNPAQRQDYLNAVLSASADNARDQGARVFAVGIGSLVTFSELVLIANEPASDHVFQASNFNTLAASLADVAAAVILPEATDAVLSLEVASDFSIGETSASSGSVVVTGNHIEWSLAQLLNETVTLTYEITHLPASLDGEKLVHVSQSYSDTEGNELTLDPVVVNVSGCAPTLEQLCPCDGGWRNHGQYVSCVARATNTLVADGFISTDEKEVLMSEAAQSNCGR